MTLHSAPVQPLTRQGRYAPLDILRGLALLGVLLVNLLTLFRVSLFTHITGADVPADAAGRIVLALVVMFLQFKAFTLFSFLFGAGVAVQVERASSPGGAAAFLLRRFLVLLAIGLIHLLLVWNGDILTLYAVCGLLLIPMLRLPTVVLAVLGAVVIVVSYFAAIPIAVPNTDAFRAQAIDATRVYAAGSFMEILSFRWRETQVFLLPLLVLTLPRTYGVRLMGVAAWRAGLLTARRRLWLPILAGGAVIGAVGTALHVDLAATVPLAFAYAAAVLLWIPASPLLAAGGQMALTNYLTQSAVFCFVFYGYGLGQFGRLDVVPTVVGGVAFYLVQLVCSRLWLRRFHFGPAEWLWRSLSYGRRQPMLRGDLLISQTGLRVMLVCVLLFAVQLIHGGMAWTLGAWGPHWGWTAAGAPGRVNDMGLALVAAAMALLAWILATALGDIPRTPERTALGLGRRGSSRPVHTHGRGIRSMSQRCSYGWAPRPTSEARW